MKINRNERIQQQDCLKIYNYKNNNLQLANLMSVINKQKLRNQNREIQCFVG